jgi:hypothetical protein
MVREAIAEGLPESGRGVYGGFGRATRKIGNELSKRNVEVTAVVPQREGSRVSEYMLDGMRIREFPARAFWRSRDQFRQTGADVFLAHNHRFLTFLLRRKGLRFAIGGAVMTWFAYLYGFVGALVGVTSYARDRWVGNRASSAPDPTSSRSR